MLIVRLTESAPSPLTTADPLAVIVAFLWNVWRNIPNATTKPGKKQGKATISEHVIAGSGFNAPIRQSWFQVQKVARKATEA
jgi:hypothetical protein